MVNALQILDSEESKENFMRGIIELAKVAGIENSEIYFFHQAMQSLNLSEEVQQRLEGLLYTKSVDVELKFEDKRQGLFFLREGIQLCYVDGHYQEEERLLIRKMANQLNISSEALERIENWVLEGLKWSDRGDQLLLLEV
jgi:uncharacterized tellurite resistance protein B-like protein